MSRIDDRLGYLISILCRRLPPLWPVARRIELHPADFSRLHTGSAEQSIAFRALVESTPGSLTILPQDGLRPGFGKVVFGDGEDRLDLHLFLAWRCRCGEAIDPAAMGPSEGWDPWNFEHRCAACAAARDEGGSRC